MLSFSASYCIFWLKSVIGLHPIVAFCNSFWPKFSVPIFESLCYDLGRLASFVDNQREKENLEQAKLTQKFWCIQYIQFEVCGLLTTVYSDFDLTYGLTNTEKRMREPVTDYDIMVVSVKNLVDRFWLTLNAYLLSIRSVVIRKSAVKIMS